MTRGARLAQTLGAAALLLWLALQHAELRATRAQISTLDAKQVRADTDVARQVHELARQHEATAEVAEARDHERRQQQAAELAALLRAQLDEPTREMLKMRAELTQLKATASAASAASAAGPRAAMANATTTTTTTAANTQPAPRSRADHLACVDAELAESERRFANAEVPHARVDDVARRVRAQLHYTTRCIDVRRLNPNATLPPPDGRRGERAVDLDGGAAFERVVLLVWFGRAVFIEVLWPYLLRETVAYGDPATAVVDEIVLVLNTRTQSDVDNAHRLVREYGAAVRLLCSNSGTVPLSSMALEAAADACTPSGRHDYDVWARQLAPASSTANTLFVRVDDDVVFVDRGAVAQLVAAKMFHRDDAFRRDGIVGANVVNHCALPAVHAAIGAWNPGAAPRPSSLNSSTTTTRFDYYSDDWTRASFAIAQHEAFFEHHAAGRVPAAYDFGTWDFNACECFDQQLSYWGACTAHGTARAEYTHGRPVSQRAGRGYPRWCINSFVVGGATVQQHTMSSFVEEIHWSATVPARTDLHAEATGAALMVHQAYGTQRVGGERGHWQGTETVWSNKLRGDMLQRYRQLSLTLNATMPPAVRHASAPLTTRAAGDAADAAAAAVAAQTCTTLGVPELLPHRGELLKALHAAGVAGTSVEIGVQSGTWSAAILATLKNITLHVSIDPWTHQVDYQDGANVVDEQQERVLTHARRVLQVHGERSVILRQLSTTAASRFANGTLDLVYIDARHDYVAVHEDLRTWWPLLRAGGVLAGHDYVDAHEIGRWYLHDARGRVLYGGKAVKSAVHEFVTELRTRLPNVRLGHTQEEYASYYIQKPCDATDDWTPSALERRAQPEPAAHHAEIVERIKSGALTFPPAPPNVVVAAASPPGP